MGKDVIIACDFSSAEKVYEFLDNFKDKNSLVMNGDGNTNGSFSVSSKFGIKSTTSLSKSARNASCVIFCSLASV